MIRLPDVYEMNELEFVDCSFQTFCNVFTIYSLKYNNESFLFVFITLQILDGERNARLEHKTCLFIFIKKNCTMKQIFHEKLL